MKKAILIIVFSILCTSYAAASGFFPTTDEMFGVTMPSVTFAIEKDPFEVLSNDDGITETYEAFTIEEYEKLSKYVAGAGCTCNGYTVENNILIIEVKKDGAIFTLRYNFEKSLMTVNYPTDTRIEKEISSTPSNANGIFPDLGDIFGTELPTLDLIFHVHSTPITTGADGSKILKYSNIQEDYYIEVSRYLQICGCTLIKYSSSNQVFSAIIGKNGINFQLRFDNLNHIVEVTYPRLSHIVSVDVSIEDSVEGIFPPNPIVFGVLVPRPSVAINKEADKILKLTDGTIQEEYYDFDEYAYNQYSIYLNEQSCNVINYTLNNNVLTIHLEKDKAKFDFIYDRENRTARVIYLTGTRPEITATPSPAPTRAPTPAPVPKPATNWEYVMYKAEYDIMITYNCKTPTVLSVYMLRDKEYALMFFEFSFYAYGFPQIASYVYKGTRLPGEKDVYTYIGSDPNVYGHTLSQYTRIK